LVLAVAAQAQFFGYGGYGGYYGNYGAHPFAGVRATTAYTGIPATAAVPAPYPVAYGYPSVSATQYRAQDELGQASFGYAHPGHASSNLRDGFGNPEGKEVLHCRFPRLLRPIQQFARHGGVLLSGMK
jgi:hypothetical protein